MAEGTLPRDFAAALRALLAWLAAEKVPAAIIGGVAAGALGKPRVTRDVDALAWLDPSRWEAFLTKGKDFGFEPRLPDALPFARRHQILLLLHEPSRIEVDLSFGATPFEEEVLARTKERRVGELTLPLPTPEDLIILKAVAHRPRDLADISGILEANPGLDLGRIRDWVGQFAELLEMPEMLEDMEKVLGAAERE